MFVTEDSESTDVFILSLPPVSFNFIGITPQTYSLIIEHLNCVFVQLVAI